jgi:hypothetical protein
MIPPSTATKGKAMLKKLEELLAGVRRCEKEALAIIKAGGVGSRVEGTAQKLRGTAIELEDRIRTLKRSQSDAAPKAPSVPKDPPAEPPAE